MPGPAAPACAAGPGRARPPGRCRRAPPTPGARPASGSSPESPPPSGRGRGAGTAVCGLVLDRLVADHGMAALMVDGWNTAAVRLYRRLGLSWRPLAAARIADPVHHP
ncbi:GNAT family N-acetyltransferase [Streptomyces sp. F-1]|uniref:GNAT family N-acetyltransferase n=1 Tax=Streptomyces sp. F-1 TaxID=463642 RepID=UPI0031F2DAA9